MSRFIVYALPRSRTAWLSCYLSHWRWNVVHEMTRFCRTVDDIQTFFKEENVGATDTGLVKAAHIIEKIVPDIRVAVVRRDVREVLKSINRKMYTEESNHIIAEMLREHDKLLDAVSQKPGVMSVDYEKLNERDACHHLYDHCLNLPDTRSWWEKWQMLNVQVDMPKVIAQSVSNARNIDSLKADALAWA